MKLARCSLRVWIEKELAHFGDLYSSCFLVSCGKVPKMKKLILAVLLQFWPIWVCSQTYSTSFPLTENPLSERSKWVGGQSSGGNLWGEIQTSGGMAYGVSEPTLYGDPTAILTGRWAADQQAKVTVMISRTPTVCCHEIEVRLRVTISEHRITGYEVYCSIVPGNKYCHIARWSGPNGLYCNIEPSSPRIYLVNGDVLGGTVTGSNPALITAYLNGVRIMQVSDSGNEGGEGTDCSPGRPVFTTGSPGIGFYDNQNDKQWNDFGVSHFSANAGAQTADNTLQSKRSRKSPFGVSSLTKSLGPNGFTRRSPHGTFSADACR